MGTNNFAALVSEAGIAASNDQGETYAFSWLNNWLSRTAKSWTWPVLKKRVQQLAIAQGAASATVGIGVATKINGTSLTTHYVHRLIGGYVLWVAQAGYSPRGRADVRPLFDGNPDNDPDLTDPLTRQGAPATVKVRQSGNGTLVIYPDPTPDRAMYLNFDVHWIPPNMVLTTETPWYPNDRTLVKACECALMDLDSGGEMNSGLEAELAKLAGMVVDDRDFDGEQAGDNEVMGLDPSVFKPTGR